MDVMEVIMEWRRDMEKSLDARRKLIDRSVARMMIQAQTGRKAETRPRQTAL